MVKLLSSNWSYCHNYIPERGEKHNFDASGNENKTTQPYYYLNCTCIFHISIVKVLLSDTSRVSRQVGWEGKNNWLMQKRTRKFFKYSRFLSVFKNFTKFTGKQLCQNLLFNKVTDLSKKELRYRCFSVNFDKLLWKSVFQNKSGWMLLYIKIYVKLHHLWKT